MVLTTMALERLSSEIVCGRVKQLALTWISSAFSFASCSMNFFIWLICGRKNEIQREGRRGKEKGRERERERSAFIAKVTDRVAHFVAAKRQASNLFATPTNLFLDFFV